jgi:hypothetical protein
VDVTQLHLRGGVGLGELSWRLTTPEDKSISIYNSMIYARTGGGDMIDDTTKTLSADDIGTRVRIANSEAAAFCSYASRDRRCLSRRAASYAEARKLASTSMNAKRVKRVRWLFALA